MAGVRRYEDLEAWQIADELKREVAEGFGRFRPADNARFVEFSVSSTMETKDSLKDGVDRGYFMPERVLRAQELAERSIQCTTKYIVYLKSCKNRRPRRRGRPARTTNRTPNDERS